LIYNNGRAPILDMPIQALPVQLALTRLSRGTRKGLLTAAFFRTWRGS